MSHVDLPPLLLARGGDAAGEEEAAAAAQPAADEEAAAEQVVLPDPLVAGGAGQPCYARRSVELMAHARSVQSKRRLESTLLAAKEAGARSLAKLQLVSRVLPSAGALLGRVRRAGASQPKDLCALAFAAHWPTSMRGVPGMSRHRLSLVASRIILQRQASGLPAILEANIARQSTDDDAFVVTTFGHEWDETMSKFRTVANQGTKSCTILSSAPSSVHCLVQRGTVTFFISMFGEQARTVSATEEWLVPPHVVQGTKA